MSSTDMLQHYVHRSFIVLTSYIISTNTLFTYYAKFYMYTTCNVNIYSLNIFFSLSFFLFFCYLV